MKSENSIENEVYDLLVDRDFELLTGMEQKKVLELMTAEEYALRREVLLIGSSIFEDDEEIAPAPLVLPITNLPFMKRRVPVYQLFFTAAALILLFLLVVPFLKDDPLQDRQTEYITKVDTVFVEKLEYDTILKVVQVPLYYETVKYVNVADNNLHEEPRLLEVNRQVSTNLEASSLVNKGVNMKEDPTSILIRDYQLISEN